MGRFLSATMGKGLVKKFSSARSVLDAPFGDSRGKRAVKIMRTGPRGIREQFRDQTEYRESSSTPWEKKQKFGTKSARGKTMLGKGDYRKAWMGGSGGVETTNAKVVTVGIDPAFHPQVRIHQGSAPFVLIRPKKKTKTGQWAMKFTIHYLYGVWLTNATLERGLKIARRRISVSTQVRSEVAKMLKSETAKKLGLKVAGPREVAA